MFDKDFAFVKSFTDAGIPADYGPFNVQSIGSNLYVAYAKVDPATGDEVKGAGNGYVSVFSADGTFIKRFASNGTLNAPWAIAVAPANFGSFAGSILIGNFGDGRINVFNANDGSLLGQLKSANGEIELDGLWALVTGVRRHALLRRGRPGRGAWRPGNRRPAVTERRAITQPSPAETIVSAGLSSCGRSRLSFRHPVPSRHESPREPAFPLLKKMKTRCSGVLSLRFRSSPGTSVPKARPRLRDDLRRSRDHGGMEAFSCHDPGGCSCSFSQLAAARTPIPAPMAGRGRP
jgi:hypothetical protein